MNIEQLDTLIQESPLVLSQFSPQSLDENKSLMLCVNQDPVLMFCLDDKKSESLAGSLLKSNEFMRLFEKSYGKQDFNLRLKSKRNYLSVGNSYLALAHKDDNVAEQMIAVFLDQSTSNSNDRKDLILFIMSINQKIIKLILENNK